MQDHSLYRKILDRCGVSPAVRWSLVGLFISGITGPLTALVIAQKFSPAMQGFYYTFNSLLALSVFVELGFGSCIVQFFAHEAACLKSEDIGTVGRAKRRISGLLKTSLLWYSVASVVILVGLGVAGEAFFGSYENSGKIAWRAAWWTLCASSAFNVVSIPLMAYLEGGGGVAWVVKFRTLQNTIRSGLLIILIVTGCGLWSGAIASLISSIFILITLLLGNGKNFLGVMSEDSGNSISWRREILPVQWRLAVSWSCGYFIFSLFNPLLFKFCGPELAGRFGMTWSLVSLASSAATPFLTTRSAEFARLIAEKKAPELRDAWMGSLVRTLTVCVAGTFGVAAIKLYLGYSGSSLEGRLLDWFALLPLLAASIVNQYVSAVAALARAEKREPFLLVSILSAGIVAGGGLLVVAKFAAAGLALVYLLAAITGAVFASFIVTKTYAFK